MHTPQQRPSPPRRRFSVTPNDAAAGPPYGPTTATPARTPLRTRASWGRSCTRRSSCCSAARSPASCSGTPASRAPRGSSRCRLALALLHLLGPASGRRPGRSGPPGGTLAWLALVVVVWIVLVVLAPSFAWCAVPLFYTGLRTLPPARGARARRRPDRVRGRRAAAARRAASTRTCSSPRPPSPPSPPPCSSTWNGSTARQRALIDDLIRTRRELAASERREGTLAERQRLSMEIHDTPRPGPLQPADAAPGGRPGRGTPTRTRPAPTSARAASVAEHNLAEARRFVHDLAPADLARRRRPRGGAARLAARESERRTSPCASTSTTTAASPPLPDRVQSALLRIAQGALANVREHAAADHRRPDPHPPRRPGRPGRHRRRPRLRPRRAAGSPTPAAGARGHGLPAMRARLRAARRHPHRRVRPRRGHRPVRRRPPGPAPHRPRPRRPCRPRRVRPSASCSATTTPSYAPGCSPCSAAHPASRSSARPAPARRPSRWPRRLAPDVVLMDLQLGAGIDGVEATRRLTAPTPPPAPRSAHVLVLTTYDTDADITRAIEAGATGYLLKAERPDELFAAIHAAAQGRTALSAPVARRVLARMRSPRPTLTDRERDILGQLARGLGNREIARALFISEATVKTHLGRIYDKLGVDTRSGAVSVAKEQRLLP